MKIVNYEDLELRKSNVGNCQCYDCMPTLVLAESEDTTETASPLTSRPKTGTI